MVGGSSFHHVTHASPIANSAMCIGFLTLGIDGNNKGSSWLLELARRTVGKRETQNMLGTNDCTSWFQCDSHGKQPNGNATLKPHRAKSLKGPNDPRRRAITRSSLVMNVRVQGFQEGISNSRVMKTGRRSSSSDIRSPVAKHFPSIFGHALYVILSRQRRFNVIGWQHAVSQNAESLF